MLNREFPPVFYIWDKLYIGGIGYYRYTGEACPGYRMVKESPTRFVVRQNPQTFCPLIDQRAEYIFVLGQLEPGSTITIIHEETAPGGLQITIPPTTEPTITSHRIIEGKAVFRINGLPAVTYSVQRTSDFETWTGAGQAPGDSDFTDPTPLPATPVYYRLLINEPPPRVFFP